jgi:DNA-binding CsgD family transcriptional regulator
MTETIGRATRIVARLTHEDRDLNELRHDLDRELRSLVGWDVAAWATTDPATMLFTSCVLIGRDEDLGLEARLFETEFGSDDRTSFASLARRRPPVAALSRVTGGDLQRSERWRSVLGGVGVTDELRAAFVEGAGCWGTLVAYRFGGPPFSDADSALLAEIAPAVAAGLRRSMLAAAALVPAGEGVEPGVVLLRADGAVAEMSAQAERWLAEVGERGRVPSVLSAVGAAARVAATSRADVPVPADARLARDGGGWIRLHGSLLRGSGQVAVVVEPATELHLADLLVRAYRLTPREREITELVARGQSTTEIAAALFISPFTVQDHLKSILEKAGVGNRRELVAALHGRHYAPSTRAGGLPSPYGWYLPER